MTLERVRAELVAVARRLARAGLAAGSSGNLSGRAGDVVLVSRGGARLGELVAADLVAVRIADGTFASGDGVLPTKELPLHLGIHRESSDVGSVLHVHSPWSTAVACLPMRADGTADLPLYSPYAAMRLGAVPVAPYARPGSVELALGLVERARSADVILMERHGAVAMAPTAAVAADLLEELEAASQLAITLRGTRATPLTARELADLSGL